LRLTDANNEVSLAEAYLQLKGCVEELSNFTYLVLATVALFISACLGLYL